MSTITDDMVERAGFALFRCTFGTTRTTEDTCRLWYSKELSGATREDYRRRARAALEAALNTGEASGQHYTERQLRAGRSAQDKLEKLLARIEADLKDRQTKREDED